MITVTDLSTDLRADQLGGMSARLLSLLVVVVSLVMYHVTQRAMPSAIRPTPLFTFVYGVAMTVMAVMVVGEGVIGRRATGDAQGPADQFHLVATNWAPWLLALSVAGIELGVYAMYRSGWPLSTASITSQSIAVTLLAIIGVMAFSEHMNPGRLLGIAFCAVGAVLLTR